MENKNKSVKELETEKDYVNVLYSNYIVIDRAGDFANKGFYDDLYKNQLSCSGTSNWREATEEEVIEAFKKHLVHRYGKDWQTMKIKEKHPDSDPVINDGSWSVDIYKAYDGWNIYNKHGLLYRNGIWVERLEDIEAMNKKAIEKLPIDKATTKNLDIALRSKSLAPHRCPVCNGSGLVPNGFYMQTGGHWPTTSTIPETCRSCGGTGIVWG